MRARKGVDKAPGLPYYKGYLRLHRKVILKNNPTLRLDVH